MENPLENITGFLSSLKTKNIKFNPTPWKTEETTDASTNINVSNDTFVDLHVEVAKKVDTLIAEMEGTESEEVDTIFGKVKSTLKL